jgi:DNA-binding NarL/FixJ family response regulator
MAPASRYDLIVDFANRGIRTVAAGGRYFCSNVAAAAIAASPAPMPGSVAALGRRERAVLQLLAEGHPTGSVAEKLYISVATVETHRRNIMRKLGLHSTAQLVRLAIREGLVTA